MTFNTQLVVGAFYWVIPEPDPDSAYRDEWEPGQAWLDEMHPARFGGRNARGELLWNFIDIDGLSNWPVLWIGEVIQSPIVRTTVKVDMKTHARDVTVSPLAS